MSLRLKPFFPNHCYAGKSEKSLVKFVHIRNLEYQVMFKEYSETQFAISTFIQKGGSTNSLLYPIQVDQQWF